MSFLTDLRNGFRAVVPRQADTDLKAYGVIPTGVMGRPQYPARDIESLQKTYTKNEIVYASINRKVTAAIGVRLIVETRSGPKAEWQEEPGHPFRRLMMRPNSEMLESDFLGALIVGQDVSGLFYAEKVYDGVPGKGGIVRELHPLNPAFIAPIPRDDGKTDYQYKEGSYKEIIPHERMLVKRKYDPTNRWGGLAPLSVALGAIDADNAQTDFIRAFFNNAGVPSGLLKIKGRKLNQEDADAIRAKWFARFGRQWGRQHDLSVLDEDAEYQKVGASLSELSSQEIRSLSESRIAMTLDVPPLIIYAYVGLLRADYSNLQGAWKGFWTSSLKPMYKDWSDFLTWRVLSEFSGEDAIYGETIRLRWDYSEVEWLRESKTEVHELAAKSLQAGGITLNEYRARIGEQSDPQGDYYLRSFNLIAQPAGEVPDADLNASTDTTPAKGQLTPLAAKMFVKASRAGRQMIEKRIERDMKALLRKQYQAVAAAVEKAA